MRASIVLSFVMSVFPVAAKCGTWSFTALEYPPFACEKCSGFGASAYALKKALKTENISVQFTWLPWPRAIMEAREKKTFHGYFPAWPEDCQDGFTFSGAINFSPLGLVERRANPLKFENLQDLQKYTLGVVQDYGNSLEFNKLVRDGQLKTEVVTTDVLNVRKAALGRIDGALIDAMALKHIINFEHPELRNSVQLNKKSIELKALGLCFRNDVATELAAKMKTALKRQNSQKIVDDYLRKYFEKADANGVRQIGYEISLPAEGQR